MMFFFISSDLFWSKQVDGPLTDEFSYGRDKKYKAKQGNKIIDTRTKIRNYYLLRPIFLCLL